MYNLKFQYLPELHWKRFSPQLFGLTELVVGIISVVELDFSPSPSKQEEKIHYFIHKEPVNKEFFLLLKKF